MDSFSSLLDQSKGHFFILELIVIRFYGAMTILPMFSDSFIGKMVKMSLCFPLAMVIYPAVPKETLIETTFFLQVFFALKEFLIGYLCGFILSIPIWLIESIGNLIDNQRGEQMGAVLSKITTNTDSSLSKLLMQAFMVYFLQINGLIFIINFMYHSFFVYPLDSVYPFFDLQHLGFYIKIFENFFLWTVVIAAPVVVVMFLVEVVLGLMSSFLPSLNVTVLSMPIKSAVGIFVLIIYVQVLFHVVMERGLHHIPWFLHVAGR